MNERIRVIVATDRFHFLELCRKLGLNPHRVKYVNFKDGDKGLAGYYRDNIYPDEYAKHRPYSPESED